MEYNKLCKRIYVLLGQQPHGWRYRRRGCGCGECLQVRVFDPFSQGFPGTLSEMREFLFCAEMGVCPYFVHICVEIGVNEWTNTHCKLFVYR